MKITVYVATAESARERLGPDGSARRHDLGKFFTREAAEAHVARMGSAWRKAAVEEREEDAESQHQAHQGAWGSSKPGQA